MTTRNQKRGHVVKNRSKFKDIQRFKEIAEILNITFEQAEEMFWTLNKKTVDERYLDFVNEVKRDDPDFEFSVDISTLNISKASNN